MIKSIKKGLPWYHYRTVWLIIIIIPIFILGVSIYTVYIANSSNLSGGAHESYYKKGLSPNELAPREQHAKELGLSATLTIKAQKIIIVFNKPLSTKKLAIKFQHPMLEARDFTLPLQSDDEINKVFSIKKPDNLRDNKWDIFVDSSIQDWRVKGRLLVREDVIYLTPFGQ